MRFRSCWAATALSLVMLGMSSVSSAALVDRGGGLIYDDGLNITWLADANYAMTSGYDADGKMTWSQAMTWAGNLAYSGYTDWRLPSTLQPDPSCGSQLNPGGSFGLQDYGYNCTGSEMGHLFYNELGGVAGQSITTIHNANYNLFQNVQSSLYWSGTEYAPNTDYEWIFYFNDGYQYLGNKAISTGMYALAVRPGDVAAVPVPAAVWLFGSGLLGLIGIARRKAA